MWFWCLRKPQLYYIQQPTFRLYIPITGSQSTCTTAGAKAVPRSTKWRCGMEGGAVDTAARNGTKTGVFFYVNVPRMQWEE